MNKKIFLLSAVALLLMVIVVIIFNINSNPNPPVEILKMEPIDTSPSEILGDCDQSATTTDCSNITETTPTPEVIEEQEPPLLDTTLNDEHLTINNTLIPVTLCGETNLVRQILIDNVDVMKRIEYILEKGNLGSDITTEEICRNISSSFVLNDINIYTVKNSTFDPKKLNVPPDSSVYNISISSVPFIVIPIMNQIYTQDLYLGSPIGPIGTLK